MIIVSWNTRELLARCLDSLFQCTSGLAWETIVVDNGSQDGSPQMVKERFPGVILLENQLNLGFAAANNQGILASKGSHVFLLNSDTVLMDNVPLGLLSFMDTHPKAGAVGCHLVGPTGKPQAYAYGRDPTLRHLIKRNLFRAFQKGTLTRQSVQRVDWVSAAAMAVRREALDQAGFLDEEIPMYFEDVDLCLRLRQAGWQVWLEPHLEVVHLGGGT
ncbi:MAG: glycosyltransferase family 2 protein, partial [Dehalococcoidia bacterium]|nr:glycosyltransferase family 2 protein [Dehalococcoidia bacterium]